MLTKQREALAACAALNITDDSLSRLSQDERTRLIKVSAARPDLALRFKCPLADSLRVDPYVRAEPLSTPYSPVADAYDAVRLRDIANEVFDERKRAKKLTTRAQFCAWNLFRLPHNQQKLFMPAEEAVETLAQWDVLATDMATHSRKQGIVTSPYLAAMQKAINQLWQEAEPLCSEYVSELDEQELDAVQYAAARSILTAPATVLCSMGGCGKSFTTQAVVRAVANSGTHIAVLAPTHKARHNVAAGIPEPDEQLVIATLQSFTLTLRKVKAKHPPLLIFIDEASMLDVETFGEFAHAVVTKCMAWQLCLVGDEEQLPPVGRGECFRTAIKQLRKSESCLKLTKCYRASFVPMFEFHLAVRSGSLPDGDGKIVVVQKLSDDNAIIQVVKDVILEEGAGTVFIAWQNEHVDMINRWVQRKTTGEPKPGMRYNVGDRVVYCGENQPGCGLTNAMCGTVVSPDSRVMGVKWESGRCLPVSPRDVKLAYCLTVHKAQGSGFDSVCVVCLRGALMLKLLDRRWLYTAVSRARNKVRVICTKEAEELTHRPIMPAALNDLRFA